jgi:hypothetical protein
VVVIEVDSWGLGVVLDGVVDPVPDPVVEAAPALFPLVQAARAAAAVSPVRPIAVPRSIARRLRSGERSADGLGFIRGLLGRRRLTGPG